MADKPIIAVDVDDVLAASVSGWVAYSNAKWGTNLTPEDYHEDWITLWGVDHETGVERARVVHESGLIGQFEHDDKALPVLKKLARRYSLVVVTSRVSAVQADTLEWLDKHYKGLFDGVFLAGLYEKMGGDAHLLTKAETLQSIGAQYVIDDQPKHCFGAAAVGIKALLFGDYAWSRNLTELPEGVTRARDWAAVGEYFDEQV